MDSCLVNSRFKAFNFKYLESHHSFSGFSSKNSNKLKRPSTVLKYTNNPQDSNSKWGNYSSPIRLKAFSAFLPIIKKIKDFVVKASKIKWASSFQGCSSLEALPCEYEGTFSQNGAIGMALLSVTSTAKVKISPFVATLAANPTFVSGLFAWAMAQSIKVFLNFWVERKWDLRLMFASGGMPSSHSALCTALTTSVAICHGVADSLFPVCLGFSLIVMYDATGVRRHAGMQAEVLNVIIQDLFQGHHPISQRKLKELLGHTPFQAFGSTRQDPNNDSRTQLAKYQSQRHLIQAIF